MKFDYKSYSNHLESENERLNVIIDEIEKINEDQLTEIFMLQLKIKKAIEYIKENFTNNDGSIWHEDMKDIYKILGGE